MRKRMLVSLALLLLLSGCGGQELANVTIIQTLGVDGSGPVELTAVGDAQQQEAGLYRTGGEDVTQAQEGLKGLGATRLEVTHVAQLVLGPEADVTDILWQTVTHRKSGYGATVWLSGETVTAGELLAQGKDPSQRLMSLEENAGVRAPTVLEALSALVREGEVELPVLAAVGEELHMAGYQWVKAG